MTTRLHFSIVLLLVCGQSLPGQADSRPTSPDSAPATQPGSALPAGAPPGMGLIDKTELLAHAGYLASDELGGRLTGSPGQQMAAEYIAKHFAELGLEPLGDKVEGGKRGWFQWYDLLRTSLDMQKTLLVLGSKEQSEEVRAGFAVLPPTKMADLQLKGGFVFAGTGTFEADLPWENAAAVVTLKVPSIPGAGIEQQFGAAFGSLGRVKQIAAKAEKAGSKALIVCIREADSPLLNVLNYIGIQPGKDLMRPAKASASAIGGMDTGGMGAMFAAKIPVIFTAPKLSEKIMALVTASGDKKAGPGQVHLAVKFDQPAKASNVVGLLRGSDANLAKEALVYSAHMDHIGLRMDGDVFNGADDNASGSAGLLEIAQAYGKGTQKPKRSVIFLSVSGEELGLWGSAWFAANPTWPVEKIAANINTDMIGRSGPESKENEIGVTPSFEHEMFSTIVQEAARKAKAFGLTLVGADKYYMRSDHYNFAKLGIPVVFFCDGEHEDYHMVSDHAEKLDGNKMERSARLAYWTGWEICNAKGLPETLGRRNDWLAENGAQKPAKKPTPKKKKGE